MIHLHTCLILQLPIFAPSFIPFCVTAVFPSLNMLKVEYTFQVSAQYFQSGNNFLLYLDLVN